MAKRKQNLTSPHGNLLVKSMPVMGVPVGGKRIALSIQSHSTFKELLDISQYLKQLKIAFLLVKGTD